ncbi:MAG: hypothetical protein Q9208_006177 [Pyrenodesmia sp. 3 TL-2023]
MRQSWLYRTLSSIRTPRSEESDTSHKFLSRSNGTPLSNDRTILDQDTSPSFHQNPAVSIDIMYFGFIAKNFLIGGYGPSTGQVSSVRALCDVRKLLKDTGRYSAVSRNEPEVYRIDRLLQKLWANLQPALKDIKAVKANGNPKISRAYTTFFADTRLVSLVGDILTKVTNGTSMLPGNYKHSFNGSPVFWSVTSRKELVVNVEGKMVDVWDYYLENNKTLTAFSITDSPYIVLYPYFWESNPPNMYGDVPPAPVGNVPAWNCLTVDRRSNRFRLTDALAWGSQLIQWRTWVLMEELVHHYNQLTQGTTGDTQNANLLITLPPFIRLFTPQAYMYYAACKLPSAPSVAKPVSS